MRQEIIRFYNATPGYRSAEEWIAFIEKIRIKAYAEGIREVTERLEAGCDTHYVPDLIEEHK